MTGRHEHCGEGFRGWDRFGRSAERFARRVAREAERFASRVEEHVSEFARDTRHAWRPAGPGSADQVRRVFEEVRGIIAAVLDGIDELITDVFQKDADEPWARVVCNHEAHCETCGTTLAAGAEAWVRKRPEGPVFRCLACGTAQEKPGASEAH